MGHVFSVELKAAVLTGFHALNLISLITSCVELQEEDSEQANQLSLTLSINQSINQSFLNGTFVSFISFITSKKQPILIGG